jgi:transcriptional regulator with XRE-family HTH domain|tara:strand:+ start:1220 stop:1441 length:222 start_codon:yes stop_codon:yes gene_type:complete
MTDTIGKRIKHSAKLKFKSVPISEADIAKAVGIAQPSVNSWANDRATPTIENFRKLADYLEVDTLWLMYGEDK